MSDLSIDKYPQPVEELMDYDHSASYVIGFDHRLISWSLHKKGWQCMHETIVQTENKHQLSIELNIYDISKVKM